MSKDKEYIDKIRKQVGYTVSYLTLTVKINQALMDMESNELAEFINARRWGE